MGAEPSMNSIIDTINEQDYWAINEHRYWYHQLWIKSSFSKKTGIFSIQIDTIQDTGTTDIS